MGYSITLGFDNKRAASTYYLVHVPGEAAIGKTVGILTVNK